MPISSIPPAPLIQENFESHMDSRIEEFILAHIFYKGRGNLPMSIPLKNGFILRVRRHYRPSELSNDDDLQYSLKEDTDFIKARIRKSIKDIKSGNEFVEHGRSGIDYLTLYVKIEQSKNTNEPYDPNLTRRKYLNVFREKNNFL